jgi:hypothetical protein
MNSQRTQWPAVRAGEFVADHDGQIQRLSDRLNPADEVDRRTHDSEVEAIGGPDVAVDRRFPPPWRVDKIPGGYIVRDANRQALAYVYSRENEAEDRGLFAVRGTPRSDWDCSEQVGARPGDCHVPWNIRPR